MKTGRKRKTLNTGAISIGTIVLAFLVVMSIQIIKLKEKDETNSQVESQKLQEYEAETQRAQELEELEKYMNIDNKEFVEDIAKSKLGLAYENEIIFKEREE